MMGRCMDAKWCSMYSDGQMERKDGVWMQQESNKRGGERGSERGPCQSPVRHVQGLKNVCDIPLLSQRVFQGLLSDIVILQKALMGLQRYQAPPSERDRAAVLCWVCRQRAVCLSLQLPAAISRLDQTTQRQVCGQNNVTRSQSDPKMNHSSSFSFDASSLMHHSAYLQHAAAVASPAADESTLSEA